MDTIQLETGEIEFNTKGFTDILDITQKVEQEIIKHGFLEGHVTLFAVGSTTALGTIEYESRIGEERHGSDV